MPVEVPGGGGIGGAAADRKGEVWILQSYIDLGQQSPQHAGQVSDLRRRNIAEAGHVPKWKDVSGEGRRRGEDLHHHEILAGLDDACLLLDLPVHHVAKHAFSVMVIMPQSLVQAMPELAGTHQRWG